MFSRAIWHGYCRYLYVYLWLFFIVKIRKQKVQAVSLNLFAASKKNCIIIAVRLRVKKKVQNLNAMWYKEFAKNFATQGDFGHESP